MAEITLAFTGEAGSVLDFMSNLFPSKTVATNTPQEIPGGATITMLPMLVRKSVGFSRVLEVVLSIGGGVSLNVVSSYIYDKLKSHKGGHLTIKINRREVHLDKGEITKVIEEEIKVQER